jgi:hypothetical protein
VPIRCFPSAYALSLARCFLSLWRVSRYWRNRVRGRKLTKPRRRHQPRKKRVSLPIRPRPCRKPTQNPVANLISVPVQNNSNFSIGPYDRIQDVLNIQPVIPMHIAKRWNRITRIIQPIVWQPYPTFSSGAQYGFGDMNPTFFLSPAKPGKIIWGAGPAFVMPMATSDILGQGKLSIGPSLWRSLSPVIGRLALL